MQEMQELYEEALRAMTELCESAQIGPGDLVVVGCSTSEIQGARIGTSGTLEVARAALKGLLEPVRARGGVLAVQCCEHLNRALIVEREAAEKFGYEPVCVIPQPKAGGSFATAVWKRMKDPVPVEHVRASAGLDIGCTLIGMHLKEVAVPLRLSVKHIGEASVSAARTRPKLIGGVRAVYPDKV